MSITERAILKSCSQASYQLAKSMGSAHSAALG
jgi:hypothetical protein